MWIICGLYVGYIALYVGNIALYVDYMWVVCGLHVGYIALYMDYVDYICTHRPVLAALYHVEPRGEARVDVEARDGATWREH
jgi:hypothetical protein